MPAISTSTAVNVFQTTLFKRIQAYSELFGRQLMVAIFNQQDLTEAKAKELLSAGVNYINPDNGNTALHYLYIYNHRFACNLETISLFLNVGADPKIKNAEGLTPYSLAKEKCFENWQTLKRIFDLFMPSTTPTPLSSQPITISELTLSTLEASRTVNVTDLANNETTLAVPHPSYVKLGMLVLPVSALVNGSLALAMDKFEEWSKQHYNYLPGVIHYGLKPMALAVTSASMNCIFLGSASSIGLEAEAGMTASFFAYAGLNYFSLLIAQPIERTLAKKIQNKVFNILFPILLYSAFLDPSLFLSEGFLLEIMPMLMISLANGLLFKAGAWGTEKALDKIGFFKLAADDPCLKSVDVSNSPEREYLLVAKPNDIDKCIKGLKRFIQKIDPLFRTDSHNLDTGDRISELNIVKFRLSRVKSDINQLIEELKALASKKSIELEDSSDSTECASFDNSESVVDDDYLNHLEALKTCLNDFYSLNKAIFDLDQAILPTLHYITALHKNWKQLCDPDFLIQCLTLAAENEKSNISSGYILLSESNFNTVKFDFLKLEMFNYYLEANVNSKHKVSFSLPTGETEESLKSCFQTSLGAIKTTLFSVELDSIVDKWFSNTAKDLEEKCTLLATHFKVVCEKLEDLKKAFIYVMDKELREGLSQAFYNSSKLCSQRESFAQETINRLHAFSEGRKRGIQDTLHVVTSVSTLLSR